MFFPECRFKLCPSTSHLKTLNTHQHHPCCKNHITNMPSFRDNNILLIAPGSETTLTQYGLAESLGPASFEFPSVVYKSNQPGVFASSGSDENKIYPVQQGRIVHLDAFNYLIKLIYTSLTKDALISPALMLISSGAWTRPDTEAITQYAFETIKVPGFSIMDSAQAAVFAYSIQDAFVIDIGKERTVISPVLEYNVVEEARESIAVGGDTINQELSRLCHNLTASQIEDLKRSPIFEVLNADDSKNSWFGVNTKEGMNSSGSGAPGEDDGIVDIAAIVSSGRTREILAEREKIKKQGGPANSTTTKKSQEQNMDLEKNEFEDSTGQEISVGKERFQGTSELIKRIVIAVGEVARRIDQVNRRQDLFDNLIYIGRGSSVKGLKEAITNELQQRYLISRQITYSELPSTLNTGQNTPNGGTPMGFTHQQSSQLHQGHGQVPVSVRMVKMPEYFPEWKGHGWETVFFLGAQIAAKQIFNGGVESSFVSRNEYNEVGPTSIWDII